MDIAHDNPRNRVQWAQKRSGSEERRDSPERRGKRFLTNMVVVIVGEFHWVDLSGWRLNGAGQIMDSPRVRTLGTDRVPRVKRRRKDQSVLVSCHLSWWSEASKALNL